MMGDYTSERMTEPEPGAELIYDRFVSKLRSRQDRAENGRIVIKGSELSWQQSRQGRLKFYLNSQEDPGDPTDESALQDWDVFIHDIRTHSGAHRHQGGLVIYVIEGSGYTIVEGERVDWAAGDLLLLPVVPGGVEHQHFSDDDERPAKWIAFIYRPLHNAVGSYIEQVSTSPDFA